MNVVSFEPGTPEHRHLLALAEELSLAVLHARVRVRFGIDDDGLRVDVGARTVALGGEPGVLLNPRRAAEDVQHAQADERRRLAGEG